MRSHADRYRNVFFAYRGLAVADIDLTAGRQLEDNLTRALTVTLDHASPETRAAFVHELCGLDVPPNIAARARLTLQPLEAAGDRGVLVGISPRGGLGSRDFEESPAGSRPDLLIDFPDGRFVIIESKAVGGTDGSQLWRHARAFGLELPRVRAGKPELPASWIQQSWSDIAAWANGEHDDTPVAAFLLQELAEYLDLAGVTRAVAPVTRARPAVPASVSREPIDSTVLVVLAESVDLDAVARVCTRLYGDPGSPHYVYGDDETGDTYTTEDSATVRDTYRRQREKIPPGLALNGGNVITARRALSIAYGPKSRFVQSIATAQTRDAIGKLIGVGADRAVLLGLLAWAWPKTSTRAERMRTIIAGAWERAPVRGHAADELHEELPPAAVAALALE